jgi:3-hydroxybutyrate dehydrogenase
VDDFPPEIWDEVLNVNLNSAFHTIRLALPLMKKNPHKWGRIINISSVHGLVASANKSAYVTAKHGMIDWLIDFSHCAHENSHSGLNGLTKVVALENASETQITCNAICPGWVHTPLVQKQIEV